MNPSKVQFLVGTDHFQLRLAIDEIKKGVSFDRYDAKSIPMQEILDQCNTLPMFASSRLIQLTGIEKLKEEAQELLCAYFENPSPTTLLLCIADKLDKRTKIYKVAQQKNLIRELTPPKPRELSSWVQRLCKMRDLKLPPQAEQLLIDSVGANLELLDQQLEKLSLYVYPRNEVTLKDVGELVLQTAGEDLFSWTDQVVEGKIKDAIETLSFLLDSGDAALALVSLLARHIRILLKALELHQKGISPSEYAHSLGVPPFVVNKYVAQSRKYSKWKLLVSLRELSKLDRDLKSTGLPTQLLLEKTVRTIATGR